MPFKAKYKAPKLSKDGNIVVHCMKGGRSMRVTAMMLEMGFTNVVDYPGGIFKWNEHFTASTLPS